MWLKNSRTRYCSAGENNYTEGSTGKQFHETVRKPIPLKKVLDKHEKIKYSDVWPVKV